MQIGGNSDTITNTDLSTSGSTQTFTWSSNRPTVTSGTTYHIVYKTAGYVYADGVTEVWFKTDSNGSVGNNEVKRYYGAFATWLSLGADVGMNLTVTLGITKVLTWNGSSEEIGYDTSNNRIIRRRKSKRQKQLAL